MEIGFATVSASKPPEIGKKRMAQQRKRRLFYIPSTVRVRARWFESCRVSGFSSAWRLGFRVYIGSRVYLNPEEPTCLGFLMMISLYKS